MSITTMDRGQVQAFHHHLDKARGLGTRLADIRTLAVQLSGRSVLPVIGAGASYDCGMRLAREIGQDLLDTYLGDNSFNHVEGLDPDLAKVAQAIWKDRDQKAVVRAVELNEPEKWPDADGMGDHFCSYRVLARFAREQLAKEAIGFNYDCGAEAGLDVEGFLLGEGTEPGRKWQDHASVIADDAANAQLGQRGGFTLFKAHGCAVRYREVASDDEEKAAKSIVIRTGQLNNWRNDGWMRDAFNERARHHVLLLVGFSGQDPVIHGEMELVFGDVFKSVEPDGQPRVVVVDAQPNTGILESLIKIGLGEKPPAPNTVSLVGTKGATVTSALLVLLAESIAHSLEQHGVTTPSAIDARLASLVISAPVMLRWSYFLRQEAHMEFMQRSNLQQFGNSGYVPLTADPARTAAVLAAREQLRDRLGHSEPETCEEALANSGFIVDDAMAYLPVGLDPDELSDACRSGEALREARRTLEHPDVECVLVPANSDGKHGVDLGTGNEIKIA
jgi:hypothetical protein